MKIHTACVSLVLLVSCGGKDESNPAPTTYTLTLSGGANGTLTADPAGPTYAIDSTVTLTATPDANYRLGVWTGTENDASRLLTNTVTMDRDKTVGVTFELITATMYTLTLNPGANGTINANPAGPTYVDNTVVALTAVPDANFALQAWSGTDNDASTSTTNAVTMIANKTVSATFVSTANSRTLTLTTTPTRAGNPTWGYVHATPPGADYNVTNSASPESTQVVYPDNTVVTLVAHQAASTWGFANWVMPDSSTPTTCTVQVTMDADKQVTANFPLGSGVGGVGCP